MTDETQPLDQTSALISEMATRRLSETLHYRRLPDSDRVTIAAGVPDVFPTYSPTFGDVYVY